MLAKIRQFAGHLIAGLLLFFLIKPFVQTQPYLKNASLHVQWHWLIPSFGVFLFYRSAYLYPFTALLSRLMQKQVSFRSAWTLFHLATITRYLPGRIWGIVRLLSLSKRFGLSKTAVGSSLTLHVGVETVLGGLIAISLLFSDGMRETTTEALETFSGQTVILTIAVIVFVAGFLFCTPKMAKHTQQFFKTLTPLLGLGNVSLWMKVLVSHSLLWICQGFAFFLFVRSFAPVSFRDAGVLTACFAFAWVVGFLSFLTPGGLGIREGLLGLLLANYMPIPQATVIALLCRVWMLSAEMVLAALAVFLNRAEIENLTLNTTPLIK